MKTAVVTIRREPHYRSQAIVDGLKRLGYTITSKSPTEASPASKLDLLCLWNRKKGMEEQAAERWEAKGGTVLIFENGYLQKIDKTRYAISVHQHNGAGTFPVGDEDRFTPLGFELQQMQDNPRGHWLVCGQRGIGSQLMASPPQWAEKMVAKLKAQGKHAKLRPHPGNFAPKVPLLTDLKGAAKCVIWSSGSGVRALVEGIPVQHNAPHWICEGWETNRRKALQRMAWGQWSVAEIEQGEPFARITSMLEGKA